jgi:hypothetical protein
MKSLESPTVLSEFEGDETGRATAPLAPACRETWLEIAVSEGGRHTKVTLNNRRSVIGRHSANLKTGTLRAILGQLGLRPEDVEN